MEDYPMNRLTLTPTVALALALAALSVPAFAQPSPTCLTGSIFGGPFNGPSQCFVAQTMNPGTGGAPIRRAAPAAPAAVVAAPAAPVAADPAPVDPVDPVDPPTSVPATPVTPMPGIITGNIADTEYAGAAPGFYTDIPFNGGIYDAIVEADGSY